MVDTVSGKEHDFMYTLKYPYLLAAGILGILVSAIFLGTMMFSGSNLDFRWAFAVISGVSGIVAFGRSFSRKREDSD